MIITLDKEGRPAGRAAYTCASTLGGVLEDQYGLGMWRQRQVVLGMGRRLDLVLAAQSCTASPVDKDKLAAIADTALEAAESSAGATIGTAIHAIVDRVDRGEPVPVIVAEFDAAITAYRDVVAHFTVHAIEIFTVNDQWQTAGTADRLVSPIGEMTAPDGRVFTSNDRLIWDLKTSGTADYFGLKFAVQLAVYAHGAPYREPCSRGRIEPVDTGRLPWPDDVTPATDWGLILHLSRDGMTADLHWVDLQRGALLAELALTVHQHRKCKGLVVPAALPRNGQLFRLISEASDEMALDMLWAQNAMIWADEHSGAARARLRELDEPPF